MWLGRQMTQGTLETEHDRFSVFTFFEYPSRLVFILLFYFSHFLLCITAA